MAAWFLVIFFFVILTSLVLGIVLPVCKKHSKVTGGIINYDSAMRKFVYKVDLSKTEIIDVLSMKSESDELTCIFDFEKSVVLFSEYGSSIEYRFEIQEYDGFSVLRLTQISYVANYMLYKINPFMVSKLGAEIVPFSQYGF